MKNIYISWHYTTHGMAYLKHILSAFYVGNIQIKKKIDGKRINQIDMNTVFSSKEEVKEMFLFDKVYQLCVKEEVIQKITDRRYKYRKNMYEKDMEVEKTEMQEIWKDVIDCEMATMDEEFDYVLDKYGEEKLALFKSQVWRDIQHYNIDEQIKWWSNESNAKDYYDENTLENVWFDKIDNLRDEKQIAKEIYFWFQTIVKKHGYDSQYIINVSLGSNETQVAWFILAESGIFPPNTRFIKTYDDKSDSTDNRFKLFDVLEVPLEILSDIKSSLSVYKNSHSDLRRLAHLKMQTYLKQGFAILILGERGTGKSRLVSEFKSESANKNRIKEINCASLDDDTKAESELFGYKRGAFTGATIDKTGLFHEARGGLLFFDEVHHLSKTVQGKLMKALQTDSENKFRFRRMGSTEEETVSFIAIFASNLPNQELKKVLLPDFYDRIAQLIIELPPLRKTPKDREEDWKSIWDQLQFLDRPLPQESKLMTWLKEQPLYGNYRDLQKIAIYYKSFLELPKEAQKLENCTGAFEFAKTQFEKYYNTTQSSQFENEQLADLFDSTILSDTSSTKKAKLFLSRYKKSLVDWLEKEYPNKKVHDLLGMSRRSYYNWIEEEG